MTYQSDLLALSPTRFYPLNETSGVSATELVGGISAEYLPNSAGAWTGGALNQAGINNAYGAALINGSTGSVLIPLRAPANGVTQFSLIVSVYPLTGGNYKAIYSSWGADSSDRIELTLGKTGEYSTDRGLMFSLGAAGASVDSDVLTLNAWNHIVVAYNGTLDASQRLKIYVNALQRIAIQNSVPTSVPAVTTTQAYIGCRLGNLGNWNGRIGDVAILPAALSQAQITALYNSAIAAATPSLSLAGSIPSSGVVGATYTGSLTASNGTAPYTYALQSGALPAGVTLNSSTGALTGTLTTANSYSPVFRVTDSALAVATLAATITVSASASAPAVTTQPSARGVTAGATATFTAVFSGAPPPTFQWQRSTNGGTTWANISGATATAYTTPATTVTGGTANNNDQYRCTATNSQGSVTTNAVALSVSSSAGTLQSAVVAAHGNSVLMNYSGTSSAGVSDFTLFVNGVNIPVVAFTLVSGFQYQLDLGYRYILTGDTVSGLQGAAPFSVTNSSTTDKKRAAYLSRRFGMFIHWNMTTFSGGDSYQFAPPTQPENTFAPTGNVDTAIDQWINAAKSAGMKYIILTSKHHDGFCLWPSASTTHDVANTAWYAANGSPDIIKKFTDKCRAAGLGIGLYFSVWDRNFEIMNPGFTSAQYIAFTEMQLNELLTNYGDIDSLWIDGFHWEGTPGNWNFNIQEAQYPYATFRNYISARQPNTVVVINNHRNSLATSDILGVELSAGGVVPIGNRIPSEACESIHKYGQWFLIGGNDYYSAAELTQRLSDLNAQRHAFLLNCPPGVTGLLPAATVKLMSEVGKSVNGGWGEYGIYNRGSGTVTVNVPTPLYGPGFGGNFLTP